MFVKENLLKTDYVWNNDDKMNLLSEGPTRRRFDRLNGDCMLHMINLFDYAIDKLTIPQAQRIELLIQKELPSEMKSEVSVLHWLKGKHAEIFKLTTI